MSVGWVIIGVAVRDWGALRAALGRIGAAEQGIRGSTTALEFSGRGLIGTARLARAHPLAAGAAANCPFSNGLVRSRARDLRRPDQLRQAAARNLN